MKKLSTALLVLLCWGAKAQKLTEYKASNGVTYHLKDTIKLGKGSGQDGWFVYMLPSQLNTSDTQRDWFKRKFTNGGVVLKKIEVSEVLGVKRYLFIVGGGAMYNFHLNIEEAISNCEVIPCSTNTTSNIDQLLKLKQLLDAGGITKEEYEAQKKKLLN